ncbi:MAG: hypothetical protein IPN71_11365 [Fibrobacteres bacterium]|nr:hypothetical protein [Fibrobacterota bacterium]
MQTEQTMLDRLLTEAGFSNHDLVAASADQLSHKNVQKARKGVRPVTDQVARTIARALNALLKPEETIRVHALFPGYPRGKSVDESDG